MATNIDRSLDEIIKEQRKLKKSKAQKLKAQQAKKKGTSQQQGKKPIKQAASNQNQRKRVLGKQNARFMQKGRGMQARKTAVAGKQNKAMAQGRRSTQKNSKMQSVGNTRQGRISGARVTANRLKNKQGPLQKTKKVISKAKQLQQNRQRVNRQNRQTQQKDARQNILNKRRGMQGLPKGNRVNKAQNKGNLRNKNISGTAKFQRINRKGNTAGQLTISINNPGRVRLNRASPQWQQATNSILPNRRRWSGRGMKSTNGLKMDSGDLRISVPNNLFKPPPATLRPLKPIHSIMENSASGTGMLKTYATLNERFSDIVAKRARTIILD
ncbi:uncharacterized protein DDB_G0290301-like [Montipora foliosa]|uniref:uncharacterized protein DDB_G0290301-like n=1 Tax=Montipora foliosa TaxID=591990 RepID=UPI0035F19DD6